MQPANNFSTTTIMADEVRQIINGDLDLYSFLEVDCNDDENAIRRQYRKKALVYHPDKSGDASKFNLLNTIYNILINDRLRDQYDKIRQAKLHKSLQQEQLNELTRKFQQELLQSEKLNQVHSRKPDLNLEQLKHDGIKKRRLHEQQFVVDGKSHDFIPFQHLSCANYISSIPSSNVAKVKVKWKYKPELEAEFQQDVLKMIMEIFGTIKSIQILPHKPNSRYDSALIEYDLIDGLKNACNHDFKKSASLWDGTPVRRLASLMRECKEVNKSSEIIDAIIKKYNENRR